jgi:hypothetical protein
VSEPVELLLVERRHVCAECLRTPKRIVIGPQREDRGTVCFARCHGRVQRQVVPDVVAESSSRIWWFLDPDDVIETRAERERRELADEVARLRAAMAGAR